MKAHEGQLKCDPGIVIMGLKGDQAPDRPDWVINGSIMAFRKLHQRVPEFDKFLADNPIKKHGLTDEEGSALRGARMVGRWKSVSKHITSLPTQWQLNLTSRRLDS